MDGLDDGTLNEDQPAEVTESAPPEGTSAEVESFTELDPTEAPDGDVTPEWLQERYKQMQADYTRKRQADSETAKQRADELEFLEALRSDPETQRAVFEQLQELLADEDYDDDSDYEDGDEDPTSDLARQVEELRQVEEERQARALATSISDHIETLAKEAGIELDEDDFRDVFGRATGGDDVSPDVTSKAFESWHAREKARHAKWQKSYLDSKQAPAQVPPGQSAQDAPDLSDPDVRRARMAAIIAGG